MPEPDIDWWTSHTSWGFKLISQRGVVRDWEARKYFVEIYLVAFCVVFIIRILFENDFENQIAEKQ